MMTIPRLRRCHWHYRGQYPRLEDPSQKLHLFSTYTKLRLKTSKCEATRALWTFGNPLTSKNQTILQDQINTVTFPDGSHIKYIPPDKSYKMLDVHINKVLDFIKHHTYITKDVKKPATALSKRKLRPIYKSLVV